MDCLAQHDEDHPHPRQPSHPEGLGCLIGTDEVSKFVAAPHQRP
jgi:hypothetical protein